ncbi:MAG TPA: GspE/PulE family protein [Candidatus Pacearchaeota archaeon]|jgi:type II secretory ATPase GspE/PulE/Tfp pilus assembly ATPase PilB-like protein|nr:GspE/PulE family protein [Candidatus Pacearchaeota archaeon]HRR94840.1 GspE/PulE family protein [Candidatus Paceibacterota bacterium]HPC30611.1 GspE/PulE family protein [Candidatus Pacearchaeota archaeon]HQG09355.1 GspE/PulE family protein [Candidatus Pacearchaeota archaeon]HQH20224.1 GspE/PulE family protein [Candidatus Pacearchaeota archaeon]
MEQITDKIKIEEEFLKNRIRDYKNIPNFKVAIESAMGGDTTLLTKTVMAGSILLGSSDLHLEATEIGSLLRIRVDGLLQQVCNFGKSQHKAFLGRIKLLAGLKLNVEKKPQDGRFTVIMPSDENDEQEIEIRVSTLPSEYGESIVMRILNPKSLISLEDLGLRKDLYEIFNEQAQKPNGMILVTGPTGSGKTTTLYAFLKKIRNPEIKIITIEDPIEYRLEGITQTQVDPTKGYDFASGLRSIVRQDPDAILVGEIRDLETASIALQAALTGHLVLSTLHTNDSTGAIPRLQALGEQPANIAPAINMVIAQRLVRKLCPKCMTTKTIPLEMYNLIQAELSNLPKNIDAPGLTPETQIGIPKGCEFCNFTGYKGRIGIFEAFLIDDEMEEFILTSPPSFAIKDLAIKKGLVTMKQDGLIKILQRITTLEEVIKVTG